MTALDSMKTSVAADVNTASDLLTKLSHDIWDNPELAFEEEHAASVCIDALSDAGFSITTGVSGLETAFIAEYGSGPLTVGICSEMDALPGVGHACGHNMIAAAGVGAGIGLARIADEAGITIRVLGTPAEEGGGGKIIMLEDGAFDGLHLAMMVHPSPMESDVFPTLASTGCDYHFHGKSAHSSLAPHEGINAADAVTIAQVSIGVLRQHLRPGDQVHGIVTDGGDAPNIVPSHSTARYVVRAPTLGDLGSLRSRIDKCFEAGALATGASLTMNAERLPYSEFRHDEELALLYRQNGEDLGRVFSARPTKGGASTDMANVSLLMPTIHPSLGLDCAPAVNHQPEFAQHCRTDEADTSVLHGAISMAQTCVDAAVAPQIRERLLANETIYGGRDDYPWKF